jgi:hypothetical protein
MSFITEYSINRRLLKNEKENSQVIYTLIKRAVHTNTQRPMVTTDLARESSCLGHKPSGYVSAVRST